MTRDLRDNLIVTCIGVVTFLALFFVLVVTVAAKDSGQYAQSDPAVREWFKSVKNKSGVSCCDISDGHRTEEERRGNSYWVPINGNWTRVPDEAVIYDAGNPVGQAVVWYSAYSNEIHIRCFVPGAGI